MAFQYQIYPTGDTSQFKTIVSSPSGVSAILDKQMGINEHSMSGVAFYINNIESFIHHGQVGTSTTKITSGYFTHLGYWIDSTIPRGVGNYTPSTEGMVSGVNVVYVTNTEVTAGDNVDIGLLATTSGTFRNTILQDSVGAGERITTLEVDGELTNVYSGLTHPTADPVILAESGGTPYIIKADEPLVRAVLVDSAFQHGNLGTVRYGIRQGILHVEDFEDLSSGELISSGNIYVRGGIEIDLSILSSGQFSESLIQVDSHTHDGTDSRQLSATSIDSTKPVNETLSLIMNSGDIRVFGDVKSNHGIGFMTEWEVVETGELPLDNMQRLHVLGDRLLISDKVRVAELGSSLSAIKIPKSHDRIATMQKMSYLDDNKGDGSSELAMISFVSDTTVPAASGYFKNDAAISLFPSSAKQNRVVTTSTTTPSGAFGRRYNHADPSTRMYGRTYYSVYERPAGATDFDLGLYEFDPVGMRVRNKATVGVDGHAADMLFMTPFGLEGNLVMPYRLPSSTSMGIYVHNPVYNYIGAESGFIGTPSPPEAEGELSWYPPSGNPVSGVGSSTSRFVSDFDYFNGNVHYLAGTEIFSVAMGDRNEPIFRRTGTSGDVSLVTYAGKLYTGEALQITYDRDGNKEISSEAVASLQKITGNSDPWVYSPVVHDGWIYALAVPGNNPASGWFGTTFSDKYLVNYDIPDGAKLVRRRAAEIDLSETLYSYTV